MTDYRNETYVLTSPMMISSRLLPAVAVGDAILSIEFAGYSDDDRCMTRLYIDRDHVALYSDAGPSMGVGQEYDPRECLGSAMVFLAHDGERWPHADEGWLYSADVAAWASIHADELSIMGMEVMGEND